MTSSEPSPRRTAWGVVGVWIVAALTAGVIGLVVPVHWRAAWLAVALGGMLVLAFGVQLWHGRSQGFTQRVAAGTLGAVAAMGLVSAGFGLAAVVPG